MAFYPPNISKRFNEPENAGSFEDPSGVGTSASFSCGSYVRISLQIDQDDKFIRAAKFKTNGCGFAAAAADVITEHLDGTRLTDLHGLNADGVERWLNGRLEEFPPDRFQCRDLVFNALKGALADFRLRSIEEFQGEKALICTCFGVTEERIISVIEEDRPQDASEVADICNAGSGCGSCQMMIQEMIDTSSLGKL